MDTKEFETLGYKPPGITETGGVIANPEQPNKEMMIIEEIEGLMSQVNEKLEELDGGHYVCVKAIKKAQALEEIDIFQKTTLFELRKAFE